MDNRSILSGYTPLGIAQAFNEKVPWAPAYRARQVSEWIARGATSFEQMSNLPQSLREELNEQFLVRASTKGRRIVDTDGTVKVEIVLSDGARVEAVLLVDAEGRRTACLSTQAGCPAGCVFCKTGSLGFLRNLRPDEIVEQYYALLEEESSISNIVIMGMGEPLLNFSALSRALEIFSLPGLLGRSLRRITLSTSGIISGIDALIAHALPVRLALSLTTADEELRNRLMPIGKANPLPQLKEALLRHQAYFGKRITLEMVLLGGLNCRTEDVHAASAFANGLDVLINLIPWNPVEGLSFEGEPLKAPRNAELARFARLLEREGLSVQKRLHRGRGVLGACGQLGSAEGLLPADKSASSTASIR